jgi:crossover junction endodeoxyribonuclease RusA
MTITLTGEPKSNQHIYKMTCRGQFARMYMSREGRDIMESYQWQAKSQWRDKLIEDDVHLTVKLFFGRKGVRDIDNYCKLLLDSLTGIVWKDDGQIIKMTVIKWFDKNYPRIEVEIL